MPLGTKIKSCANCGYELHGKFCSHCGQNCRAQLPDILSFLKESFSDYFDVDSRAFRSLKNLFFLPGKMTAEYLEGKRQRYLPPFSLFFGVSLLFLFTLSHMSGFLFHFDWYGLSITTISVHEIRFTSGTHLPEFLREIVTGLREKSMTSTDFDVFDHVGGALLCLVPLLSLLLKTFYPKKSLMEHLVFSLHLYSGCLIILLPGIIPFSSLVVHDVVNVLLNGIILLYLSLMLRRVYGGSRSRILAMIFLFVVFHAVAMLGIAAFIAWSFLI